MHPWRGCLPIMVGLPKQDGAGPEYFNAAPLSSLALHEQLRGGWLLAIDHPTPKRNNSATLSVRGTRRSGDREGDYEI